MPLHILIALVVGGIGGIALLLHLTGRSRTVVLTADTAPALWLRHFPDERVKSVTVAKNGMAAWIMTDVGPGLVWVFGADTVARRLREHSVTSKPGALRVRFHDAAAPWVSIELEPDERATWQRLLETT